jgi:hypothetical protein
LQTSRRLKLLVSSAWILGRDVLNRLDIVFSSPAWQVIVNP